jgi:hypothetical protein
MPFSAELMKLKQVEQGQGLHRAVVQHAIVRRADDNKAGRAGPRPAEALLFFSGVQPLLLFAYTAVWRRSQELRPVQNAAAAKCNRTSNKPASHAAASGAAAYNLHRAAAVWHMLHPLDLLLQPHLFWCSTRRPSVFMPRSSRYDACASITPPRMLCMLRTCSSSTQCRRDTQSSTGGCHVSAKCLDYHSDY